MKRIYSTKSTTKQVSGQTAALMPIAPHKGDLLLMSVLLDTWGQETTQIFLGKIIRPIQNLDLFYSIELN